MKFEEEKYFATAKILLQQAKIFINILIASKGKEIKYTGKCLRRCYNNTIEEYFG